MAPEGSSPGKPGPAVLGPFAVDEEACPIPGPARPTAGHNRFASETLKILFSAAYVRCEGWHGGCVATETGHGYSTHRGSREEAHAAQPPAHWSGSAGAADHGRAHLARAGGAERREGDAVHRHGAARPDAA